MTPTDSREDVLVLAHNYVRPEVQDYADVVGDSLELARLAVGRATGPASCSPAWTSWPRPPRS